MLDIYDTHVFVICGYICHVMLYWFISGLCYVVDRCIVKYPKLKYLKIQKNKQIDFNKYHATMKHMLFLHLIAFSPATLCFSMILQSISYEISFAIPPLTTFVMQIIVTTILFDFMFYIGHRIMHTNSLYIYHKKHHEWTNPVGVSAHYSDIFEYFVIDIIIAGISPILINCNSLTTFIWLMGATIMVVLTHSGFNCFFIELHDIHHEKTKYNYGIFISDYIFGTNY